MLSKLHLQSIPCKPANVVARVLPGQLGLFSDTDTKQHVFLTYTVKRLLTIIARFQSTPDTLSGGNWPKFAYEGDMSYFHPLDVGHTPSG